MYGKKFLSVVVLLALIVPLFAGCVSNEPQVETVEVEKVVTQVVEVEKEVTKIVAGTTVVETVVETMVVTATPEAAPDEAAPDEPTPDLPKVARVNLWGGFPGRMDPQKATRSAELATLNLVCAKLLAMDSEGNVIPGVAESWDTADDGMSMTFHLRGNALRADGTPITAQDFEWVFRRIADPRSGSRVAGTFFDIVGIAETLEIDPENSDEIEQSLDNVGVKATDDETLVMTFNKPAAGYFPYLLVDTYSCPVDRRVVEADPDGWWTHAENHNSGGPFVMSEIQEQQKIIFLPNPNYWGGEPKLDRIELSYITDSVVSFEAYKAGELDIVAVVPEDLSIVEADPILSQEFMRSTIGQIQFLSFGFLRPPFDDVNVRKAFSLAFDGETFLRDGLGGKGQLLLSWITPDAVGYDESIMQVGYDPEAAVQALIDGGYGAEEGSENPIDCEKLGDVLLTYKGTPRNHAIMQLVAGNLISVFSCPITLNPVESTTMSLMYTDPNLVPMLSLQDIGFGYPHAQNYLMWWAMGAPMSDIMGYYNEEYTELYNDANSLLFSDPDAAIEKYKEAHRIFLLEDYGSQIISQNEGWWLVKSHLVGFKENFAAQEVQYPGQNGPVHTYDIDLSLVGEGYPTE